MFLLYIRYLFVLMCGDGLINVLKKVCIQCINVWINGLILINVWGSINVWRWGSTEMENTSFLSKSDISLDLEW